jgi:long-chain acyl-CoA synthetase
MYSRLYHNLKDKLRDAKGCEQSLLRSAFDTKLENLANSGRYEHWFYDRVVFRKTKEYFGGRVRYMLSGGAPLLPHVHSFMKVAAVCPVFQGYGLTESTGASFMTDANDPTTGHVGGPTVHLSVM